MAADDKAPRTNEAPGRVPDRRDPERPDRRGGGRGGRRATDTLKKLASFAYKLLTEPPR